jgi:hypothetical protein
MDIFNGVELSDEQKAAIQENLNSAIESEFVSRTEFDAVFGKKEELLAEAKRAKDAKRAAEEEAEQKRLEAAAKNGDIESLTKSYEEKLAGLQSQLNERIEGDRKREIGNIASGFVNENVVDDPLIRKAMTEELSKRLDLREGKPVVLDTEGNLTALSTDDLFSEFQNASVYKPHLVASKASGGSATGSTSTSNVSGNLANKNLADCKTQEERLAVLKARTGEA